MKYIKIRKIRDVTPPGLDGHRYVIKFDLGKLENEQFNPDNSNEVTVTTSGTLESIWDLPDERLGDASATAALSVIADWAGSDLTKTIHPVELNTYTARRKPPPQPFVGEGSIVPVSDTIAPEPTRATYSILSDDISELRDQINTVARALIGDRLLELPQERALLDAYKAADTPEAFRHRILSLAGLCQAINKAALARAINVEKPEDIGSISLLHQYLLTLVTDQRSVQEITDVWKSVNELRKGYPTHVDHTAKFLAAHDYFGITYPISDYPASWEKVLKAYYDSLAKLLDVLGNVREKHRAVV